METTQPNTLLKYALLEMAQLINREHLEPQAALDKVAGDMDLNPNLIKLASAGLNVALHYQHFKKHAEDRDQDFPITRAESTIKQIFGKSSKTANALKAAMEMDAFYEQDELPLDRIIHDEGYKKACLEILGALAPEAYEMSTQGVCDKSADYLQRLEKKMEDCKVEKVGAEIAVTRSFSEIVDEFTKDALARAP